MPEPAKAPVKAAPKPAPKREPLPKHKAELAWLAIEQHAIPSYEAWDMTVEELTDKLEALRG